MRTLEVRHSLLVMPGLVPDIHVFLYDAKTWMAGTNQVEPGHDGLIQFDATRNTP